MLKGIVHNLCKDPVGDQYRGEELLNDKAEGVRDELHGEGGQLEEGVQNCSIAEQVESIKNSTVITSNETT